MTSSSSQLVNPQEDLRNVKQIWPALNETFVLLCQSTEIRDNCLTCFYVLLHVDKNNGLIERYNLNVKIHKFTMINPQ